LNSLSPFVAMLGAGAATLAPVTMVNVTTPLLVRGFQTGWSGWFSRLLMGDLAGYVMLIRV
jgi:hypothetical protein